VRFLRHGFSHLGSALRANSESFPHDKDRKGGTGSNFKRHASRDLYTKEGTCHRCHFIMNFRLFPGQRNQQKLLWRFVIPRMLVGHIHYGLNKEHENHKERFQNVISPKKEAGI
jgi:hypothetical protein